MKIEIGESLIYSWLRHVQKCQVVQLNWKPSSQWPSFNLERVDALHAASLELFGEKVAGKTWKKLLKQAEIDAVGVRHEAGRWCVTAVDVAFHEGGLQYGSKQDTADKVAMKLLRAVMCSAVYFNACDAEVFFATPKVNPATLQPLAASIAQVQTLLAQQGFEATVDFKVGADFAKDILEPVLSLSGDIADTAELFLRSHQLMKLLG